MRFNIDQAVGVDKTVEITYRITDVFATGRINGEQKYSKAFTFFVRTVNEAIGNDDEEVTE